MEVPPLLPVVDPRVVPEPTPNLVPSHTTITVDVGPPPTLDYGLVPSDLPSRRGDSVLLSTLGAQRDPLREDVRSPRRRLQDPSRPGLPPSRHLVIRPTNPAPVVGDR